MSQSAIDGRVNVGLRVCAAISLIIVGLIVLFLLTESLPAVGLLGPRLFTDSSWNPSESIDSKFGLFPILVGTLLVTAGSILIAAPIGVMSAVFSQYYASTQIAFAYRRLIELLAGIPSVVFGFWGLVVLSPLIADGADRLGLGQIPGPSLLTAILIVAMMILPTVMLITESALSGVRRDYISSAAALGMSRISIVRYIAIPEAKAGIVTGIILAAARAIGETMAVVMVAGNIAKIPGGLLDPVRTLTANIALEMGYAVGVHRSSLFFSGLLLLFGVSLLFGIEIYLRRVVWRSR